MKMRGKGAKAEFRRGQVLIDRQAGDTVAELAKQHKVHPNTISRDLKVLRDEFQRLTEKDWIAMRDAQLKVLELMENSLLEGNISTKTADSWRAIRSDISKLLGLDAPAKSLRVNVDQSAENVQGYRRFVKATMMLSEDQVERVYAFIASLPKTLESGE